MPKVTFNFFLAEISFDFQGSPLSGSCVAFLGCHPQKREERQKSGLKGRGRKIPGFPRYQRGKSEERGTFDILEASAVEEQESACRHTQKEIK